MNRMHTQWTIAWGLLLLAGLLMTLTGCGPGRPPGVTPEPLTEMPPPQTTPGSGAVEPIVSLFQSPIQTPTPTPTPWIEPPPPTRRPTPTTTVFWTLTPRSTSTRRPGPTATPIPPRPPAPNAAGTLLYLARSIDNPHASFRLYAIGVDENGQPSGQPVSVLMIQEGLGIGGIFGSPDGRSILVAAGGLHTMFPYLLDVETLTFHSVFQQPVSGRLFGWHPDGHTILVWADEGLEAGLWLVDLGTGAHTVLTFLDEPDAPASPVQGAAVSPDGQWVAFIAPSDTVHGAMWLVSTTGGDARVLSNLSGVNYVFSWSPDSTHILYAGGPAATDTPILGGPLWLMDAHGQNNRPFLNPFIFGWGFEPVWSPNGQWIALTGHDEGQDFGCAQKDPRPDPETCEFEGTGIYMENIVTGEMRRLARGIRPTWSPDGLMLAFLSNEGGGPEIWVIQADGTGLRQVTAIGQFQYFQPVWVPVGR